MDDQERQSELRRRLIEVGAPGLADALLDLADWSDEAAEAVQRIAATPDENLERFRSKVDDLIASDRFYDWQEAPGLARELQGILKDLEAANPDPRTALELIASFLRADGVAIETCHDAYGEVGMVFTFDARRVFTGFARRVDDEGFVVGLLLDLLAGDRYGPRMELIDHASDFLSKTGLESLVDALTGQAEGTADGSVGQASRRVVESLARQLRDPALFERTRLAACEAPTVDDAIAIADVHVKAGNQERAVDWLQRFDEPAWGHRAETRDRLLLAAYAALADTDNAATVAWRRFHRVRTGERLRSLLALIGEDQRDRVVADEAATILASATLQLGDVEFLIEQDLVEQAAEYVMERRDQLDGGWYSALAPIAEAFETSGHGVAATIVFRALLDSVLQQRNTAAYRHGARYLQRLDALAAAVAGCEGILDHTTYVAGIRRVHGRKWRFWQRYEEAGGGGG